MMPGSLVAFSFSIARTVTPNFAAIEMRVSPDLTTSTRGVGRSAGLSEGAGVRVAPGVGAGVSAGFGAGVPVGTLVRPGVEAGVGTAV